MLVFGAGGTGKTTFGTLLSGELDTDSAVLPYVETPIVVDVSTLGKTLMLIRVAPGQVDRRPGNWDELFQELAGGKAIRVVNVVAWGHQATKLEHTALRSYRRGMPDEDLRHAYLDAGRAAELEALRDLMPHLKSSRGPLKMLTLITKQDLWWKQRHEVQDYYTKGEYNDLVDAVKVHKGAANFQHEIVSAALVQQNLRTADGFIIAETATGYDDPLRLTNLEAALAALRGLFE